MAHSYDDEVTYLKETGDVSLEIEQEVTESVRNILSQVREEGDKALRELTEQFDDVEREEIRVTDDEIEAAQEELAEDEMEAIENTISNVREFHEEQVEHIERFEREFKDGINLGQRIIPVQKAGTYIPGGRHPLVASPAMTIVPAKVAGVEKITACAPPQPDGSIQPAQLYSMVESGADEIYCIGGSQAIGAMAYGTETVPSVDKITGPGNVFVIEAKRQVFGHVGIDFLAGPTEVLILIDGSANPALVATDLLAQAEHDPRSRPILVSTDEETAQATLDELHGQLPRLETEETAEECWQSNGEVIVAPDMDTATKVTNDYAMEHLQVMTEEPRALMDDLHNYGSLFLGPYSPVVFGDKAVGTNHSLPTLEVSEYSGGVWVGTYMKTLTHQQLTQEGAAEIAPLAARICDLEGTHAHKLSAEARMPDHDN